jgi:Ca2+-binding EF-hand superfamily protein
VLSSDAVANTVGHAQAEAILREADLNGDGEIDFEEFMAMMRKSEPSSPVVVKRS